MSKWKPHYIKEQLRMDALYSLFNARYQNRFHFPGETHNFWEILYVRKGHVCVSSDEQVYDLSEGEIVFHKPMELHKFYVESPQGATLLIASFSLTGPLATHFEDKVFRLSAEQKNIVSSMLQFIQSQERKFHFAWDDLSRKQSLLPASDDPIYLQHVANYLMQLLLSLVHEKSYAPAAVSDDALIFQQAVHYIKEHIRTHLSVPQIAEACSLSESGLKRLFAKYAGLSVHKYVTRLKFAAAAEFLRSGMNVNEVADYFGFSSQSYFSVAFKRETGKNPSQLHKFLG